MPTLSHQISTETDYSLWKEKVDHELDRQSGGSYRLNDFPQDTFLVYFEDYYAPGLAAFLVLKES